MLRTSVTTANNCLSSNRAALSVSATVSFIFPLHSYYPRELPNAVHTGEISLAFIFRHSAVHTILLPVPGWFP